MSFITLVLIAVIVLFSCITGGLLLNLFKVSEKIQRVVGMPLFLIAVVVSIGLMLTTIIYFLINKAWLFAITTIVVFISGIIFFVYRYLTGAYTSESKDSHITEKHSDEHPV